MTNGGGWGWRRAASAAFVVIAFVFLGLFVRRNVEPLRAFDWTPRPLLLAASIAANIAGNTWGVWAWQILVRRLGVRISLPILARIWFLSALGRYVPGKIWQFVGAAHLGSRAGLPPVVAVTSLAVHTGIYLAGAVLAAVYLLPSEIGELGGFGLGELRWLAPLSLLVVHPAIIGRALEWFHRVAGRPTARWTAGWLDGVGLLLLAFTGWVLSGLALHLFLSSLVPLPWIHAPAVIGINALAFLVGYAVFLAPAGLGAKEGALAALLTVVGVPVAVAALLAVAARLWTVAGEVIPALLLLRLRDRTPEGRVPTPRPTPPAP